MKLERCTYARLFSVDSSHTIGLPSGDIQDLEIPEGIWQVLIFSHYSMRDGFGPNNLVGAVSDRCELHRYIFGRRLVNRGGKKTYAETHAGNKELQPGDIFVPVYRVPTPA